MIELYHITTHIIMFIIIKTYRGSIMSSFVGYWFVHKLNNLFIFYDNKNIKSSKQSFSSIEIYILIYLQADLRK